MSLIPLSTQASLFPETIHLIATNMDGTLTRRGRFTSALLQALEAFASAKIPVIIITGRSAGWVQGLKSYLPVTGAIAENGGVFFATDIVFDSSQFPYSVGVANVLHYTSQLRYLPTYVTSAGEGEGFNELAQLLLSK